jgi:hypothetical protein
MLTKKIITTKSNKSNKNINFFFFDFFDFAVFLLFIFMGDWIVVLNLTPKEKQAQRKEAIYAFSYFTVKVSIALLWATAHKKAPPSLWKTGLSVTG